MKYSFICLFILYIFSETTVQETQICHREVTIGTVLRLSSFTHSENRKI